MHFWPGLDRHLGDELLDVEVELGRAGRGVRAEDRAVQRVGLGVEPHALRDDAGVRAQPLAAVAAEPVNPTRSWLGEVVEQVAGAAADELHRSPRAAARLDDQLDQPRGEVGRLRWRA